MSMIRTQQPKSTQGMQLRNGGEVSAESPTIAVPRELPRLSSPSGRASGSSVELHIEELVLHGFPQGDRYRIGDALQRELTRLFSEQDAPAAITNEGEIAHLDGGTLQVAPGSNPDEVGARLARAIYGGLNR